MTAVNVAVIGVRHEADVEPRSLLVSLIQEDMGRGEDRHAFSGPAGS